MDNAQSNTHICIHINEDYIHKKALIYMDQVMA